MGGGGGGGGRGGEHPGVCSAQVFWMSYLTPGTLTFVLERIMAVIILHKLSDVFYWQDPILAANLKSGDGLGDAGRASIQRLKDIGVNSLAEAKRICPALHSRPMQTDVYMSHVLTANLTTGNVLFRSAWQRPFGSCTSGPYLPLKSCDCASTAMLPFAFAVRASTAPPDDNRINVLLGLQHASHQGEGWCPGECLGCNGDKLLPDNRDSDVLLRAQHGSDHVSRHALKIRVQPKDARLLPKGYGDEPVARPRHPALRMLLGQPQGALLCLSLFEGFMLLAPLQLWYMEKLDAEQWRGLL